LLWARIGIPYSPATGLPIRSQTVSQMVDIILAMEESTRLYLLAPVIRGRKGEYRKEMATWLQKGFSRARIDGEFYELDNPPALDKKKKHDIEIVVDRLVVKKDQETLATRLADSLETALALADGLTFADDAKSGQRTVFSASFACPVSGFTIDEVEPRLFSFNNPFGACPSCDGLGVSSHFEEQLIVPDSDLSLRGGALAPWAKTTSKYYMQTLESLSRHFGFSIDVPFRDLDSKAQQILLYGSGNESVQMTYDDGLRSYKTAKPFEGIIPNLTRRFVETDSNWVRDELDQFRAIQPCDACHGKRLKSEALAVKIKGKDISDISALSIGDAVGWFSELETQLSAQDQEIASRILKEINERLGFLANVGLRYLNLSRNSGTLSGGESQRIRLASQIGSGLTGVLYVLDEPSIGLHQRDNDRLLATLTRLRDLGNTVLVVEHDEDAIRAADYVVDMGPGAGVHGGTVVAEGVVSDILANPASLTGQYLSGVKEIAVPQKRRKLDKKRMVRLKGATGNNLKSVNADIPLGVLTCVTGVSGGGKSTLILETLWKALSR
ncbi:MAG: excinuclease ABC subunit UvrA, partial [Candidatus Puniceispirillaceae bacterium]